MNKDTMNWNRLSLRKWVGPETQILGDSPYSVYEWHTKDGVFYVGMGKWYRFNDVNKKSRSKEFMDVYSNNFCWPVIVACGMSEQETRRIERELIEKYVNDGAHLVNKQYVVDFYHTPANLQKYEAMRARARERNREKTELITNIKYSERIIENGTTEIPSIFMFKGGCDELFPFLYACRKMNCTVKFANEQIEVKPDCRSIAQDIELSFYAATAKHPKIANDYVRYLGNLSLMKWS